MVVINRPALIENELDHRVLDAPLSTAKVGVVGQGYVRHQAGWLVCAAELPMSPVKERRLFKLVLRQWSKSGFLSIIHLLSEWSRVRRLNVEAGKTQVFSKNQSAGLS